MKVISLVVYLRLWSNTRLHIVVHNLQRERDALEGNTFDLWNRERCHLPLLSASVELVTHSGLGTPGSSATLLRCGLRDPLFGELHQSGFGVVVRLLDLAAVRCCEFGGLRRREDCAEIACLVLLRLLSLRHRDFIGRPELNLSA